MTIADLRYALRSLRRDLRTTGAAVALQGVAQRKLGRRMTPEEIRTALSAPVHGTASSSWEPIGTMPDLEKVLKRLCLVPLVA